MVAALLGCGTPFIFADTIQLKDASAITGKILAEKSDSLVVDVGYTVLVIPRAAITGVTKASVAQLPVSTAALPAAAGQFYSATTTVSAARDVSSLVKQIGEAVVQVRTPEGLGSGFFINADGYLITNFHVIEGETEISVEVYHQTGGQLDRETYKQVKIIAINKFHDLALLQDRGQGRAEIQVRHARQRGRVECGRRRVCHRQSARPRTHRHAGHFEHQDAPA